MIYNDSGAKNCPVTGKAAIIENNLFHMLLHYTFSNFSDTLPVLP